MSKLLRRWSKGRRVYRNAHDAKELNDSEMDTQKVCPVEKQGKDTEIEDDDSDSFDSEGDEDTDITGNFFLNLFTPRYMVMDKEES